MRMAQHFVVPRHIAACAAVVAATSLLSACFTTAGDFTTRAEEYIASSVADDLGVTFDAVNCDAPIDRNVGTRFTCTAIDEIGGVWEFDSQIDDSDSFTVRESRRP